MSKVVSGVLTARKKPSFVAVIRYTGKNYAQIFAFTGGKVREFSRDGVILVESLDGVMQCKVGDFVIKGAKGEFTPCNKDIFALTYDLIF